jgi:hypothetical protein
MMSRVPVRAYGGDGMRTRCFALLVLAGCAAEDKLAPIADAGADQSIRAGVSAALSGSESSDSDGEITGFEWSLVSAPSGSLGGLLDDQTAAPTLVTDQAGSYLISLVVQDSSGNRSAPDVVEVVAQTPSTTRPEAKLSATGQLGVGLQISLNGSGSTAPDGQSLSAWRFEVLSAPTGASAAIDKDGKKWRAALSPDVPGNWIIGLTVSDGSTESTTDTLLLPVAAFPDLSPVARCGADQAVATGSFVQLNGADSFDPEGTELSYSWSLQAPSPARSWCRQARIQGTPHPWLQQGAPSPSLWPECRFPSTGATPLTRTATRSPTAGPCSARP